ncbi:MAG: hypothetical protein HW391_251 [Chloroflexi bacterium]|nr:hypothetical protein [Chloroflexota bacterium]
MAPGLPSVGRCPHGAKAHSADESVPVNDVVACARVLAAWVVRVLGDAD